MLVLCGFDCVFANEMILIKLKLTKQKLIVPKSSKKKTIYSIFKE